MSYRERFATYFGRQIAEQAARPLANGVEIELVVKDPAGSEDVFTFTREGGRTILRDGLAKDPQVRFTMTPLAADAILADPAEDIGTIGVGIARLIVSQDPARKVSISLKAGVMTLWSKGYFGVIAAGGAQFAAFLASKGLSGIGAIKDAVKKMRA